jgi:hypothetical protein
LEKIQVFMMAVINLCVLEVLWITCVNRELYDEVFDGQLEL